MTQPIKNLLQSIIPDAHRWKIQLFKQWDVIIGPMKNYVTIEKIENETLFLGVLHPAWAQELRYLTPLIKQKVNACFDEPKIKNITFRFIDFSKQHSGILHRAPGPMHDEVNEQLFLSFDPPSSVCQEYQPVLDSLHDEELKSTIAAYFIRCKNLQRRRDGKKERVGQKIT